MIRLKIDHIEIEAEEGSTVLEAARKAGISIPSMCHLKGYGNHPSCMVCLVKDNKTEAIIPSCALQVTNGMEIIASDQEVMVARRQALELLLSDHVGDCEAPCSLACPAGMNIPLMNRLIGEGRFTEALNVVKEDIALPYILGYICPAPCEKACRRKQVDEAVSVCILKRFSANSGKDEKAISVSQRLNDPAFITGKKVAIIGSGPAGLAAAYYLQIFGHSCSIYEKSPEPGGTMRYSIPGEELPHDVIDHEVTIIRSMGATFHFNSPVTEEIFKHSLTKNYDAVVLATGDIGTEKLLTSVVCISKSGYQVNEKDMSSSVPGIFVCGSAIRPHKMAVRSVAQGKTAAMAVDHYLQNKQFEKPGKMFNSRFEKLLPDEYNEYLKESSKSGRVFPATDARDGFSVDEAVREALRCLHCDCRKQDNCKLRIFANEYQIDRKRYIVSDRKSMTKQIQHDLIIYEPEKCIKCGLCVEISTQEGEKFGLAFEGRGFDVVIKTPLGYTFNESLTHTAVKCATACPTGALSLRDKYANIYLKNTTE
jgi:ferredoxin